MQAALTVVSLGGPLVMQNVRAKIAPHRNRSSFRQFLRRANSAQLPPLGSEETRMKWQLKELEDAVRNTHGHQYADAIHEPLQSFVWKSDMAYFHACEAEQILKEAVAATPGINDHDRQSIAIGKAVIFSAAPGEAGQLLRLAQFRAESHIIASAQALHSLCDIVCHVVYWVYQLALYQMHQHQTDSICILHFGRLTPCRNMLLQHL